MVLNLSQFFELALNHGNPTTTVEKEIKLIQCYFEIQNVRFNNRFDMIIDILDELMKYEIQNIILQPLIENSIHHGLEMLETKGIIQVTGIYKDDYLSISVQDNGIGFPPDCNPLKSEGYALYNINERLHLTYGQKSGLSIQSTSETGTVVTVKMYKPTPTYQALS